MKMRWGCREGERESGGVISQPGTTTTVPYRSTIAYENFWPSLGRKWKIIVRLITRLWVTAVSRSMYVLYCCKITIVRVSCHGVHTSIHFMTYSLLRWGKTGWGCGTLGTSAMETRNRYSRASPLIFEPASDIKLTMYEVRCLVGWENSLVSIMTAETQNVGIYLVSGLDKKEDTHRAWAR